jgi:hypothetical protein
MAMLVAATAGHVLSGQSESETMLTYSRGQAVVPVYSGWHPNPDGTIDLWFSYLNYNWRQEPDIPVGPDNSVTGPYVNGQDAGQPTHFLPRNNRFVFAIRVPSQKEFGDKEVVWTLTSRGKTYKAYATLRPQYIKDDEGMMREYFGGGPADGNEAPKIAVDGDLTRTLKVGEVSVLKVVATDDGKPVAGGPGGGAGGAGGANAARARGRARPSLCGDQPNPFFCGEPNEGAGSLFSVRGFRMGCFLYRGDSSLRTSSREDFGQASLLAFDPPQEKVWEDHRGGSPWATGYVMPTIPKDNTWNISASFSQPGTYVVRCQAHDGLLSTNKDITFKVTP